MSKARRQTLGQILAELSELRLTPKDNRWIHSLFRRWHLEPEKLTRFSAENREEFRELVADESWCVLDIVQFDNGIRLIVFESDNIRLQPYILVERMPMGEAVAIILSQEMGDKLKQRIDEKALRKLSGTCVEDVSDQTRSAIASILEQIAKEGSAGLQEGRALDAAIDAILFEVLGS